ncbi:hypothetical protein ACFVSW_20130 [Neobacillus sp. NPDC058068]|uniref:hypothetical protein n=1 Tax=Neobacillus sp. NPDC058068 TaxID=3346325 RepID=UPI0036DB950B
MAENIKVSPTPIQRNSADVAMELLKIHLDNARFEIKDIGELYSQYYSLAKTLEYKSYSDLEEFIPKEIVSKIKIQNRY